MDETGRHYYAVNSPRGIPQPCVICRGVIWPDEPRWWWYSNHGAPFKSQAKHALFRQCRAEREQVLAWQMCNPRRPLTDSGIPGIRRVHAEPPVTRRWTAGEPYDLQKSLAEIGVLMKEKARLRQEVKKEKVGTYYTGAGFRDGKGRVFNVHLNRLGELEIRAQDGEPITINYDGSTATVS